MSAAPEPWLPPSPDGDVERAAAAFLAPWATEWFPWPDQVRVRTHAGRAGEDLSWSGAAGAGVGLSSAARTKLGLALADGRADTENPADCELLGKIADMAVADLAGRLAGQGGSQSGQAEPSIDGQTMLRISLGDERWFLLLSIGPRARIALRKAMRARGPIERSRNQRSSPSEMRSIVWPSIEGSACPDWLPPCPASRPARSATAMSAILPSSSQSAGFSVSARPSASASPSFVRAAEDKPTPAPAAPDQDRSSPARPAWVRTRTWSGHGNHSVAQGARNAAAARSTSPSGDGGSQGSGAALILVRGSRRAAGSCRSTR